MTPQKPSGTSLSVEALSRVEGEGALTVTIDNDRVTGVQLRIYEPPRFFEGFLRGRGYAEPPDITSRICGICPVAYQMSACAALEAAAGLAVPDPTVQLRRLLYCGEWISSHALHVYFLHAPDFLGLESAVELAQVDRGRLEWGLRMKKAGNQLLEVVGGRAIHPVNVRLGGFHRAPAPSELVALRPQLEQARDDAVATVEWVAGFDFPDIESDVELVALDGSARREYPMLGERLISTAGLDIHISAFGERFREEQVPHSTALHSRLDGNPYLTGPLARYALNAQWLRPVAQDAARSVGLAGTERNLYRSIIVRAVELVEACDTALDIIDTYEPPDPSAVDVDPTGAAGWGATEAPRGALVHHYAIGDDGLVAQAQIVPPTSQNQLPIEMALRTVVEANMSMPKADIARRCEAAVRNFDPCISCATHFLDLTLVRHSSS